MSDLMFWPVRELAALVRSGELSARELIDHSLRRIDGLEPRINAFTHVAHEAALAAAEAIGTGDPRPFAGVLDRDQGQPPGRRDAADYGQRPVRPLHSAPGLVPRRPPTGGRVRHRRQDDDARDGDPAHNRDAALRPDPQPVEPRAHAGLPAISLPLHQGDDGLPIGVQLIGPPAGEDVILSLAAQLERVRPWAERRAPA